MSIAVHNRQRRIKIDVDELQRFAERALELAQKARAAKGPGSLARHAGILPAKTTALEAVGRDRQGACPPLAHIDVILVSDRKMSELHRRFLRIDGPTDVITFQHGEIFISVETARRQARMFQTSLKDEIRLYLVHGLLHLRGFDDKDPSNARVMRKIQERIVRVAKSRKEVLLHVQGRAEASPSEEEA